MLAEKDLKANLLLTREDIVFDFESFLEDQEENLPEGLDPQYMAYISVIEKPFKNLTKIPRALSILPMNAVLYQSWKTILSLFLILVLMGSPSLALIINTALLLDKGAVGFILVFFIILGLAASFIYLKLIYVILSNLIDSRKAPWLVEKIKNPIKDSYDKQWDKRILGISLLIPIAMEIPLAWISVTSSNINTNLLYMVIFTIGLIIGHIGISLMIFISIISYRYVIINTQIYDTVLQTISDRVRGYTEAHESILSKKNYEVVGVLSDTPGLSIRSLGDIPVVGLACSIFVINSLIFLIFSPLFIESPLVDLLSTGGDETGLTLIIILGVVLSALASFGAVITPLIRITWVMRKFKNKALKELDPYIFDEITGVALRRDTEITNETEVLFMLRSYIYSMKISPVHPFRLLQVVGLAILYAWRGVPIILGIIFLIGG